MDVGGKEALWLNSLWIGSELHPIHAICLRSALHHGHNVRIFIYDEVSGIPAGVVVADATRIMPRESVILHRKTGSPAPFADLFRLKVIGNGLGAWVDTDVLFVKPLRTSSKNIFAWENDQLVGNAVLSLDPAHPVYALLERSLHDDDFVPPWWSWPQRLMWHMKGKGQRAVIEDMPYGTSGPDLLTWAIKLGGLEEEVKPRETFYSLPYAQRNEVLKKQSMWYRLDEIPQEVIGIHLWFQGLRGGLGARADDFMSVPNIEQGSLIDEVQRQIEAGG